MLYKLLKKIAHSTALFCAVCAIFLVTASQTFAFDQNKVGVHILHTSEIEKAKEALSIEELSHKENAENSEENAPETWNYVTIPLTLADIEDPERWQEFFDACRKLHIIPLVRLTTRFDPETNSWSVPTKADIVRLISFLSQLQWPQEKKHIIAFNEVNHAKEWGGSIDPQEYARLLVFTGQWAHTEMKNYVVLPAALDLAAPNGTQTTEAFTYLEKMLAFDPQVFDHIDVWNSHSYPNPGFSSAPTRTGKNSLRGYTHELAFIHKHTGRELQVMITETGWEDNRSVAGLLSSYYAYAFEHIWSDERVLAVTPFVLQGSPGPFEGFSLLDENSQPTNQLKALRLGLKKVVDSKASQTVSLPPDQKILE